MIKGFINNKNIRLIPDPKLQVLIEGDIYGTNSADQEVEIIKLYEKYGEKCFNYIDGKFFITILDFTKNKIYIATDHFAQIAVFYSSTTDFIFASNLKFFEEKIINNSSVEAFIRFGFLPTDQSIYKDIKKLESGSVIELDIKTQNFKIIKYFDIKDFYRKQSIDENIALNITENAIIRSVENKITKNSAVFLSGGIDSSLIAHYAKKQNSDLKTFTASFETSYDESKIAENTAKMLGTNHTTIEIKNPKANEIVEILKLSRQPFFDSSIIPSFLVAKKAKNHTDIVLNGDGADELFAGYRRYVPIANDWYKYASKLAFIEPILPKPSDKQSLYSHIYRLISSSGTVDPLKFWLKTRTDISEDILEWSDNDIFVMVRNFLQTHRNFLPLDLALLSDQKMLLENNLIPKMQLASSANQLINRSVFLDKNLAMIAVSLPQNMKIKGSKTKYILRKLVEKNIDKNLASLPKRGFEVPLKNWVENGLKSVIIETITKTNNLWQNYIPKDIADQLISGKLNIDKEKRARFLWTLFTLEVWYENNHIS